MSFDLFVLVEQFDTQLQSAWVAKLEQRGISCAFPQGFKLDANDDTAEPIACKVGAPLVATAWPAEQIALSVGISPVRPSDLDDMLVGSADATLTARLKAATVEFHFGSSAGRSDAALLLQCYGAAALADVANGVLVDPQEGSSVHGSAAYAVAKANSDWVLPAITADAGAAEKSWWRKLFEH